MVRGTVTACFALQVARGLTVLKGCAEHVVQHAGSELERSGAVATPGVVASTTDVEQASAVLSDAYTTLTLRVPAREDRFRMRLQSIDLPSEKLASLKLSNSTVWTQPYPTYTVGLPVRGHICATTDNGWTMIGGRRGIVVSPGSGQVLVEYLSDDCEVFTATFEPKALAAELEVMLGRSLRTPFRFDVRLDHAACGSLERALELLRVELTSPVSLTDHPLMCLRLERLVMAGLLLGQPHTYSEELQRPSGFQGPRAIRLAVAAIEEHPIEITTVADIAKTCNLSVRALEDGFKRHLGMRPMAYLREVRMARAFEELNAAAPDTTTATVVAHKWGFAHYGRFVARFRQRYGCSPSEALRSAPQRRA
jgi:AraC-like DNA-binding protein